MTAIEELRSKQKELRAQMRQIDEQIHSLAFAEEKEKLRKFVGRAFLEKNNEKINAHYIYGLDETRLELHALQVSYYFDNEVSYFGIRYNIHAKSIITELQDNEVDEISKEEFDKHYKLCLQICETAKGAGIESDFEGIDFGTKL